LQLITIIVAVRDLDHVDGVFVVCSVPAATYDLHSLNSIRGL